MDPRLREDDSEKKIKPSQDSYNLKFCGLFFLCSRLKKPFHIKIFQHTRHP